MDKDTIPMDLTVEINYTNNREYREIMRKIFRMEKQYTIEGDWYVFLGGSKIHIGDIDDETLDELNIDQSRYDSCFAYIWQITNGIPEMIDLYQWSAGKFISTDNEIGICYLLN